MLWPTSSSDDFLIVAARSQIELTSAAALLRAYAKSLPVDLAPQGFSQELESLPGAYAPPGGELLLAKRGDHVLGCIALKALEPPRVAEIKRLFVRPQARGKGRGQGAGAGRHRNCQSTAAMARSSWIRCRRWKAPSRFIKASGFVPIPPYGSHPYPGLVTLGDDKLCLKRKRRPKEGAALLFKAVSGWRAPGRRSGRWRRRRARNCCPPGAIHSRAAGATGDSGDNR